MSADNWTYCPICSTTTEEKLGEAYGNLSKEQYDNLRKQLLQKGDETTMREDYEIYLAKDGKTVNVSYSCSCSNCGSSFSFDYKQQIKWSKRNRGGIQ